MSAGPPTPGPRGGTSKPAPAMQPKPASVGARTEAAAKGTGEPGGTRRRQGVTAWVLAGVVAIGVLGGGGLLLSRQFAAPAAHVGISTTMGTGEPFGGGAFLASDSQLTDKQWQQRAAAFDEFRAHGPVLLDRAEPAQVSRYIQASLPDGPQKATLAQAVQSKSVDMVALGFFDDCDEDGDTVTIRSGPVNVIVPLTHRVQYVLVPVPHGGTAEVVVVGVKDGTGGITLGMVTPEGVVHMPRIDPGQQTSFIAR